MVNDSETLLRLRKDHRELHGKYKVCEEVAMDLSEENERLTKALRKIVLKYKYGSSTPNEAFYEAMARIAEEALNNE